MPSVRREPTVFSALALAALVLAIAPPPTNAAGRFPYTAQVAAEQAQFRSGPGESFYPTADAQQGAAVEVYHEDGAWSAVRPPRGSHSWVSAKLLKLPATLRFQAGVDLESPVPVEVGVADAPAYIGSDVTGDRDAIAIRLSAGERVYVLSAEPVEGQTWIKIAPPSGEFRWIETKHLRPVAKAPLADESPADESPAEADPVADADSSDADASDAAVPEANTIDDHATDNDAAATLAAAEESTGPRGDTTQAPPTAAQARPAASKRPTAKPAAGAKASAAASHPGRGFWTQLQALELELSMMVAQAPSTWRFDDIRRDAQNLYDAAKSDDEYDAARYLLAKLAQFESTRRERTDLEDRIARRDATRAPGGATSKSPERSATATRPRASLAGPAPRSATSAHAAAASPLAAPLAAVDDGRYDASGRLVAIPTRRAGAPSYAIVDERNNVRQYVSPAPNVNLQPYVGRTVGITGVAGPSPDSTRGHVMAKRIDVLDAPVRR